MSAFAGVAAQRWRGRPWLARACRVIAFIGPVVAVTVVAYLGARMMPSVDGAIRLVARWSLVAGVALVGAVLTERLLSGLVSIATLLELDIGFPSSSPTRWRIVSLASLRPRNADPADLRPGVAARDLDAAAESVLLSYATRLRQGLQPRPHLERVRLLTMLLAVRLGMSVEDRDRLQWALLLREIGSFGDEHDSDHQLAAWLGPWTVLLRGPFIGAAREADDPTIALAAHAAAVADAYAVLADAHPYRRGVGGGHVGARLKALGEHRLSPEAVDALLTLPQKRLRKAIGVTAGAPPVVERLAPAPQPVLAATAIVVVLALTASPGPPPAQVVDVPAADTAARDTSAARSRSDDDPPPIATTPTGEPTDERMQRPAGRASSSVGTVGDDKGLTGPNTGDMVAPRNTGGASTGAGTSGASSETKPATEPASPAPEPGPVPEPEPEPEPEPAPDSEPESTEPVPTDSSTSDGVGELLEVPGDLLGIP